MKQRIAIFFLFLLIKITFEKKSRGDQGLEKIFLEKEHASFRNYYSHSSLITKYQSGMALKKWDVFKGIAMFTSKLVGFIAGAVVTVVNKAVELIFLIFRQIQASISKAWNDFNGLLSMLSVERLKIYEKNKKAIYELNKNKENSFKLQNNKYSILKKKEWGQILSVNKPKNLSN
jgi:hypothetical protein